MKKLRPLLTILLALVFVGAAARAVWQYVQYRQGDEIYAQAEELVELPVFDQFPVIQPVEPSPGASSSQPSSSGQSEPVPPPVYVDPYADALAAMDFTALREVNDDILGWILVPNTRLSYPLVQGEDNDYYLNRTWRKSRNSVGAIFMEHLNNPDLSDFNTIIYGHRMNNKSMFGTLKYYKDLSYWQKHPILYITDDNGSHKYEIFAAYEVSVEGDTYLLGFPSDDHKQSFIDFCLDQSGIDTGVVPTVYDRILTLSTCTGNGHATRWVVQARLKGEVPPHPEVPPVETPPVEPPVEPPPSEMPVESPPSQDIIPRTDKE